MYTPVELYLACRNRFRKVCLLESNDYHSRQNSKSFIGLDPISEINVLPSEIRIRLPEKTESQRIRPEDDLGEQLQKVLGNFAFRQPEGNGFFGRFGFEFSHVDETHHTDFPPNLRLPLAHLFLFRYLIVLDHFTDTGYILENSFTPIESGISIEKLLQGAEKQILPFETLGRERSMLSDEEFHNRVVDGIDQCQKGEVFQLVLSNAFEQDYFGDDFQVYRELRRLNPSPYLFYFDFEDYRLMGSSPEAQMIIRDSKAEIHPIAGTVPKSGDATIDQQALEYLIQSEKENAEHTMLVDLARNDLSRECNQVQVESYKEVQHFSHVIHLVSRVTGDLIRNEGIKALTRSFPAGTLSGTPKPRALELIRHYEPVPREFYGGCIGLFSATGDVNTAIVIRSILSMNGTLHYRAGAGIVIDSEPHREVAEVHHKLRAVRQAIYQTRDQFIPQHSIS